MTIEDIDTKIAALTEQLHTDARVTRGKDGSQLDDASAIRAERLAIKAERSKLRKLRAQLALESEANTPPRPRAAILADLEAVRAEKLAVVERGKRLARELVRRETADELEAMPPAKRAALAQMLQAERIAPTSKVHTPGAAE